MATQKQLDLALAIAMLIDSKEVSQSYNDFNRELKDIVRTTDPKVKLSSGMYRTAAVFDKFVIKFPRDGRHEAIKQEAEYITKMRKHKKWGRHFPKTQLVEFEGIHILIQEKVDMNHRGRRDLQDAAENLAYRLGIEDMHEGNYGWKGPKGREYPVFIDVDFRMNTKLPKVRRRRSWEV